MGFCCELRNRKLIMILWYCGVFCTIFSLLRRREKMMQNTPQYHKNWKFKLSWWQLCHHWWHCWLSWWPPAVWPVMTKLASWQLSVFCGSFLGCESVIQGNMLWNYDTRSVVKWWLSIVWKHLSISISYIPILEYSFIKTAQFFQVHKIYDTLSMSKIFQLL